MTQQEALEIARKLFPDIAATITVVRSRAIGYKYGHSDQYYVWNHEGKRAEIMGSSNISWEQALDEAKAKHDEAYTPTPDEPFEDEEPDESF